MLYPNPKPSMIGNLLDGLPLEDGTSYGNQAPALYAGPEVDPSALQQPGALDPVAPVDGVKKPGLMGRIMQQPGGSKALLAFGAQLLSSPTFFEGLGKGAMAYQGTLDAEEERIRPKTQFVGDGAYVASIDPITGQVKMKRTEVADFTEKRDEMKLKNSYAIAGLRDQGQTLRTREELQHRDRWEERESEDRRYGVDVGYKKDIEVAGINAANDLEVARIKGPEGKPPPAQVAKQISDLTDVYNGLDNALYTMGPVMQAIEGGKLSFGLGSNLRHKAALATGVGANDETVLYSQFSTMIENLRNALLMANKGVQTDGDADRAMAELIAGNGDTRSINNNLNIVYRSLQRRRDQAQTRAGDLSTQYGAMSSINAPREGGGGSSGGKTKSGVSWRIVN